MDPVTVDLARRDRREIDVPDQGSMLGQSNPNGLLVSFREAEQTQLYACGVLCVERKVDSTPVPCSAKRIRPPRANPPDAKMRSGPLFLVSYAAEALAVSNDRHTLFQGCGD
jgi:hypothetical protein